MNHRILSVGTGSANTQGFSLIELIFAMSFMTLIILGVVNLQSSNLAMINRQNQEIQAHFYANQGLEVLKVIGAGLIRSNCASENCVIVFQSSYGVANKNGPSETINELFERDFTWSDNGLTDAVLVTMSVRWEDSTGDHTVSAKRIILN